MLIDRSVCHDAAYHKRNQSSAWVGYAKAYDITLHEFILTLLHMLRTYPDIINCIRGLMPLWKTKFMVPSGANTVPTGWINFNRGIFQGDSLSPILFCISFLPLSIELRHGRGYSAHPPARQTQNHPLVLHGRFEAICLKQEKPASSIGTVAEYYSVIGMNFRLKNYVNRGKELNDSGIWFMGAS